MAQVAKPPFESFAGARAAIPTALVFYAVVIPAYYALHFIFWLRRPLTQAEFDLFGNIHIGLKAVALLSMLIAAGPLAAHYRANRHFTFFIAMFLVFISYSFVGNFLIHTTLDSLQPR
jgi:hypothetical protein